MSTSVYSRMQLRENGCSDVTEMRVLTEWDAKSNAFYWAIHPNNSGKRECDPHVCILPNQLPNSYLARSSISANSEHKLLPDRIIRPHGTPHGNPRATPRPISRLFSTIMRRTTPITPTYIPPVTNLSLKLIRDAFPPITSLPPLPPFTLRIPVTVTSSPRRARLPIQYSLLLPPIIRKPLEQLSVIHSELTNEENVVAYFKVVRGTPCPRWHVDKVPLRGLCTLHGPGCVIVGDDDREIELRAGDMAFLPGSGYEDDREGVVHRSPRVPDVGMRMLLQTDCAERC